MSVQATGVKNKKTQTLFEQPNIKQQLTQTELENVHDSFTQTCLHRKDESTQFGYCLDIDDYCQTDKVERRHIALGTDNNESVDKSENTDIAFESTSMSSDNFQTQIKETEIKLKDSEILRYKRFDDLTYGVQLLKHTISLPDYLNRIKIRRTTQTDFLNLPSHQMQLPFGSILPSHMVFSPISSMFSPLSSLLPRLGKQI